MLIDQPLAQLLFLLGVAVAVMMVFLLLRIPTSLGYLLVGVILGPHTGGPVLDAQNITFLAEFGIVFLLFTVGLSYSIPQIHALRHQVLGLGTGQVVLTTLVVGLLAWLAGLPVAAAFVVGAVFAQSSTTVITRQLTDQGEENTSHGRLGTALSIFQDVTSVPFVVIFPVLGAAALASSVGESLLMALGKAILALALVYLSGRWLLRPLFHAVAQRSSSELFTLSVLLVSLTAAWLTSSLGLSMAFGAFLVGMMLGETEFRHQMEAVVRPFRDILLGLFFVGIGMLFDPGQLPDIWLWAIVGTLVLLGSKILLVAAIVRMSGLNSLMAWRTALVLAVGGEFGFALLAIAMNAGTIDNHNGQIVLMSVLFSIIVAPFLIRYNLPLATWLSRQKDDSDDERARAHPQHAAPLSHHVIICGYGRIGQNVARFLDEQKIPFIALDLDIARVKQARLAGDPVFYGSATSSEMLEAVGIASARLVVIGIDDVDTAYRMLLLIRTLRPDVHVMVRTRDESQTELLRDAGATEVVPETLESGLMIASHVLLLLDVPQDQVMRRMREERAERYPMLHAYFRGDRLLQEDAQRQTLNILHSVQLPAVSPVVGLPICQLVLTDVEISALVRAGEKMPTPAADTLLEAGDVIVLAGPPEAVIQAEWLLTGDRAP